MPTPPLSEQLTDDYCLRIIAERNRHNRAIDAAASFDVPRSTFDRHLREAKRRFGHLGVGRDFTPEPTPAVQYRPVYRVSAPSVDGRSKVKICAIGDAHDSPFLDKSRFEWIGRHIHDGAHDQVVQIGDLSSVDSLCRFEPDDTLKGKQKPTFKQDMSSLKEALDAFSSGLASFRPSMHCTLGNHEDRVESYIDKHPAIVDSLNDTPPIILKDRGWTVSPFGAFHYVGQTAFTHAPLNTMGRTYGGMYSHNQIARDSLCDVVYGHTHKRYEYPYPKLDHQKLTVVNLGCALPDGHIERYAEHSLTGWSYGVYDLTLSGGRIASAHWVPMTELEERYG